MNQCTLKRCKLEDCQTLAVSPTDYCIRHGGGPRCIEPNCIRGARKQNGCCIKHGGGRRCIEPKCNFGAYRSTNYCLGHGKAIRNVCHEIGCAFSSINDDLFRSHLVNNHDDYV